MGDRLITSNDTEKKIIEIQNALRLSTKAAIIRICIGLSLKQNGDPQLERLSQIKDNSGSNYHKHTVFGDDEVIYYLMTKQSLKRNVEKSEFFPDLIKAHLVRGMEILYAQYSLIQNPQKLIEWIISQSTLEENK